MILLAGCIAALVAAVIERITGLGFALALIGPIVLLYGGLEGVTIAVALRPMPTTPIGDIALMGVATVIGIALGTWLLRFVPAPAARIAMLTVAWIGATVVLVRGLFALFMG